MSSEISDQAGWRSLTVDQIKADSGGAVAIGPFGSRMKSDRYVPAGVPIIRGNNISDTRAFTGEFVYVSESTADELRSSAVYANDLVFPHRGAIGVVGIVPAHAPSRHILSTSLMKLTCNTKLVDPVFIFYYFRSAIGRAELLKHSSTVGTPGIGQPLTSLRSIRIILPPLRQQQAIAKVLGALDDKIDNCTLISARSDMLINALFLSAISDERTQERPLFDVVDIDYGEPFKGEFFNSDRLGRPLIRIRDLKTFEPQVWTTEHRPREVAVQPGNVVVGMDAEFRPTAWLGPEGVLNQRVCRVTGITLGAAYVREALKQPLAEVEGSKIGTTVIHLNKRDLEEVRIPIPGPEALERFELAAEPLYLQRVARAREVRMLVDLRDTLLPRLLSGELRVSDVALVPEEAV